MNSIHRFGLAVAGVATVVTVAGAFVIQGYTAAEQAAAQAAAQTPVPAIAAAVATPTQAPEIVYIAPPTPAPTAAPTAVPAQPQPAVIHVIVPAPGGGDDGGSDN